MSILQDPVQLHLKKPDDNSPDQPFSGGWVHDPNNRDSSCLELVLLGVGALVFLVVAILLSIPDTKRQEKTQLHGSDHDFNIEPCHIKFDRDPVDRSKPVMADLRVCTT